MAKFNPYKGVPKDQWAAKRAELAAAKQNIEQPAMTTAIPNAFGTNAPELPPEPPKVAVKINSEPEAPRHIPRNLFDGTLRKLSVMGRNQSFEDPIPGYRLYWFNDPGGSGVRIAQAELSGWSHVSHDEVIMADNLAGGNDLGSQVSYIVNPNLTPPTRAYLMKKPQWLDDVHQQERETIHQRIEGAMKQGTLNAKPEDGRYTAQPGSALPEIKISSKLYR